MNEAKIQFSPAETELMNNAEIILTKNRVLMKIKLVLENLQAEQTSYIQNSYSLPKNDLFRISPKISKGENYEGLPYLVLDYPRNFEKENTLAIRTMFWWGHYFSIALQVTGIHKEISFLKLTDAYELLVKEKYFIAAGEDQWIHRIDERNYRAIEDLSKEEFVNTCTQYEYIKIAAKWNLPYTESISETLLRNWRLLVNLVAA